VFGLSAKHKAYARVSLKPRKGFVFGLSAFAFRVSPSVLRISGLRVRV